MEWQNLIFLSKTAAFILCPGRKCRKLCCRLRPAPPQILPMHVLNPTVPKVSHAATVQYLVG